MHSLALLYKKGAFIDIDKVLSGEHAAYDVEKRLSKEKALSIYCQLSALGDTKAQMLVSNHALFGHTDSACSITELEDAAWFPLYSSIAQCALGDHLLEHGDGEEVEQQHIESLRAIFWHSEGKGSVKQHHKEQALFWYKLSAAQGNTIAAVSLVHLMLMTELRFTDDDEILARCASILHSVIVKEESQEGGDENTLGQALFMLGTIYAHRHEAASSIGTEMNARTATFKALDMFQKSASLGSSGGEESFFEMSELVRRDETLRDATLCYSIGDRVHASGLNERTGLVEWNTGTVVETKVIDESTGLIAAAYCIDLDSPSSSYCHRELWELCSCCLGAFSRTTIYAMHDDDPDLLRRAPRFDVGTRVLCRYFVSPCEDDVYVLDEWQSGVVVGHHYTTNHDDYLPNTAHQAYEIELDESSAAQALVFVANDSDENVKLYSNV
jgi:TPR repeat protein